MVAADGEEETNLEGWAQGVDTSANNRVSPPAPGSPPDISMTQPDQELPGVEDPAAPVTQQSEPAVESQPGLSIAYSKMRKHVMRAKRHFVGVPKHDPVRRCLAQLSATAKQQDQDQITVEVFEDLVEELDDELAGQGLEGVPDV